MNDFDTKLIRRLLAEQRLETTDHASPGIAGVVTSRPPEWLWQQGIALLDSDVPEERVLASRLIRELPEAWSDRAGLALTERLPRERDLEVVAWFLHAFAFLHPPQGLPLALALCRHADAGVREGSAVALSACSYGGLAPEVVEALVELAGDVDQEVRFSAVFALGSWWEDGLRGAAVETALQQATRDPYRPVRTAANGALASEDQPPTDH